MKAFNKFFIAISGFVVNIPIDNFKTFYFEFVYKKYYITKMRLSFGLNAKLTDNTKNYYINNGYVYYYYNKLIKRKPLTIKNKFIFELRYVANLIKVKKVNVLFNRFLYKICKLFNKKKIWLISDRPLFAANDNGFRLFEYICKQNDKNIKPYFIIKKDLKDYNKVKSIGKTIIFNSLKYKIYFLLADKVISSQADDWTTNPFGKEECYYRDLFNYDFVFLQHGITKDDISNWLNIYAKNIKLFITSTEKEYNSLLNVRYGYDKNIVKLTGLPRYDKLEDKKKKLIAIMPTWRLDLANNVNEDGVREYSLKFKGSEYYKFFNTLINDERLLSILKKYNYKGLFVMHPSHSENYVDFLDNDICDVIDGTADYQEIFKTASLLITDYSSVAFDFAYLNKPVLYTQFDKKSFFEKHLYIEGYFSYEKDGFGPVVYDYDSTVNEIIKFIENDCKLDKKYEKRIDKFYKYRDKNNCKRVYEEIKKLDEK
jgi:CDP-glycerol glycerophosphotransferase (TagB/SpsB family)